MRLVQELGVDIGERRCGTPAAARAARAVAAAFADLGLEPTYQEFEFVGYEPELVELEVGGEPWNVGLCMYSASTPPEGVEGAVKHVGTNVIAKDFFEVPVFALEDDAGRELARLYGNPFEGGAIPFMVSMGPILGGPQVFVSTADAARLRDGPVVRARLRVAGTLVPGRRDRNVIAELQGRSDETIVVGAHYDSVWKGSGVVDNATGVEGVRRIAEQLVGRDLERGVVFVAFAAEEIALQGSRFFVEEAKLRGELDRIVGVVNLDCIGYGEHLELMVGPDELRGRALQVVDAQGLADRYDLRVFPPAGGTDHYWFAQNGVPAISILHFPYPEYHLDERIELIDERRVEDAVELALRLIEGQLSRPVPRHAR